LPRIRAFLILTLGLWLGASIVVGGIAAYNLAGIPDLLERNPALAAHSGFDPNDADAKKQSLLWAHASELNRALFETWNRAQLLLGAAALLIALYLTRGEPRTRNRGRWLPAGLIAAALALVLGLQWMVEPELVDLGRQLDFVPRSPAPPELAAFQRLHGWYNAAELLRLTLLALTTALVVAGTAGPRREL
jgi:hypothetical protein